LDPDATLRTDALALVDSDQVHDQLGRSILTAHLVGLLEQLTRREDAHSAVVHIDGRWGSGKSTLVNLLLKRLRSGEGTPQDEGPESARRILGDPLVGRYDAWRESSLGPEGWSLAAAINRTVRAARSRFTQSYRVAWNMIRRFLLAPPVSAALVVFVITVIAWRANILRGTPDTVSKAISALSGLALIALGVGRLLFWYAPIPGLARLRFRAEENPLSEIAELIGWLRRWSP